MKYKKGSKSKIWRFFQKKKQVTLSDAIRSWHKHLEWQEILNEGVKNA